MNARLQATVTAELGAMQQLLREVFASLDSMGDWQQQAYHELQQRLTYLNHLLHEETH